MEYSSFTLRSKIIIGYLLLLILLGITVYLVWFEHKKREELTSDELRIFEKRKLNRALSGPS